MNLESDPQTFLWQPSKTVAESSEMFRFLNWLKDEKDLYFADYEALWQWSVTNIEVFWLCVWEFYGIMYDGKIETVLTSREMPGAQWFTGTSVNYAEHIFRHANNKRSALIYCDESDTIKEMSWEEMKQKVNALQSFLVDAGVKKGDRVVGYLNNTPEATISFLAVSSLGAIWSLCSPDFGSHSVVDRFTQIEPKVMIAVTGYKYNGRAFDKSADVEHLAKHLTSLQHLIVLDDSYISTHQSKDNFLISWNTLIHQQPKRNLYFERVPFNDPLWILYSSGTTGIPKAITQSQGGALIEHVKFMGLHENVKPGDRYFWYSATGWVMWNLLQSSLLMGATAVLYDGSTNYPSINKLWDIAEKTSLTNFGASASYFLACKKQNLKPIATHNLSALKSIGSTGSVLSGASAEWIYSDVKSNVWLASISGGTDICSAFVAGNPMLPVPSEALQCRALGCSIFAYDSDANPVQNKSGEMVITKPMPSMPLFFWGEEDNKRYLASYFDVYPGKWRHGDNIQIFKNGTVEIIGRSDSTLNRMGVRIGTSEVYQSVEKNEEVKDSLIVNIELEDGLFYMPLFVILEPGNTLTEDLKTKINKSLKIEYSPRHVPDEIIEVQEIPYTLSGKKMEVPVKRILKGESSETVASKDAMKNPDSLIFFNEFFSSKFNKKNSSI